MTVNARAPRGVALVLLEVNGELTADRSVNAPTATLATTFTLDPADLPNGLVGVTVVVYDRDGNEVRSEQAVVDVQRILGYEGHST